MGVTVVRKKDNIGFVCVVMWMGKSNCKLIYLCAM